MQCYKNPLTHVYIVSVYLDESTGSCRPVELSDDLEEEEVRDKQLLGIDMGRKKIFIFQSIESSTVSSLMHQVITTYDLFRLFQM